MEKFLLIIILGFSLLVSVCIYFDAKKHLNYQVKKINEQQKKLEKINNKKSL